MEVKEKLSELRKLMKKHGLDAYMVLNSDKHSSEYVNSYYKERSFISSFDGSNGTVIVTLDKAYLWTDGRYFLQAELDLKNTTIELMKMDTEGYPSILEFIKSELQNKTLGFNGEYVSYSFVEEIKKTTKVVSNIDLIADIWNDRGNLETTNIWSLPLSLTGESTQSKLSRIREELKKDDASLFLSNIDDIAWVYNLRGNDLPITPVFLSFAYIDSENSYIFLNSNKLNADSKIALSEANTTIYEYDEILSFLKALKNKRILVSFNNTNYSFIEAIKDNNTLINKVSPTVLMKAIKNEVEIKNNIDVHKADGLAVFRYMKYVKENYPKVEMDEYSLSEKVLEYRKMDERFYEVSFETISSWNENGAIVHYEPTKESSKKFKGSGFALLDSGGQYMGGTTDITRTIALGDITKEMKHHYTLVLRSHIDVSMCTFKKGTSGMCIDMLSREPFWKEGLDYNHGTGHGVGYMLNVHEAPNGIRYKMVPERSDSAITLPGMICSIEPGIYLENKYGIRIENEILCVPHLKNEFGEFYKFQTITYCPYDLDAVLVEELSLDEKKWLNDYHKMVYNELSKICDKSELDYLKYVTREV